MPMLNTEELKLLSITQAANILGIGRRALQQLILESKIKFVIIGKRKRIPKNSLSEFITASSTVIPPEHTIPKDTNNICISRIDDFINLKKMEIKNGINL